jgi:nitroreductase/FMN reductase [NAD(P)H]
MSVLLRARGRAQQDTARILSMSVLLRAHRAGVEMVHETTDDLATLIERRFGLADGTTGAAGPLALFLNHRTHRRYADRPVPDDLLDRLLACALSAPAKSDLQQVAIIRVEDRGKRARFAELLPDMPWVGLAPRFLVFCGDSRRIRRICELRGKPFGNDHLDAFLNAATDAALALGSFLWAAEAAGLGCCPISVVRNHIEAVSEILELPPHVFPYAGLCVGWPAQPGWVSMRLPPAVTVHVDRYDDSDLPAQLDTYDARREARNPTPPDKQRHVADYGVVNRYGWSEDKARQVSRPERRQLAAYLRAQGFNLD